MSVEVSGAALRHINDWVRSFDDVDRSSSLRRVLDQAVAWCEQIAPLELDREAAKTLLDLDVRVYGYGTHRALRSDRNDCPFCAELGRVIESLIPNLRDRATKRATGAAAKVQKDSATLSDHDRLVLWEIDDVWQTFVEINPRGMTGRQVRGRLLSLCARELAVSRRSDANGKIEYAITDAGEKAIGRV